MTTACCPVCKSPLAPHEVRQLFTCYHCHWALSANTGDAFRVALVAAVATECVVLILLMLWFGSLVETLDMYFGLGAGCGVIVGGATYWHKLTIVPLRPQKHLTQ